MSEMAFRRAVGPVGRQKMAISALQRKNMVESQIRPSDVTDRRITSAMQDLPRERFMPANVADLAYMDDAVTVAPGRGLMAPRVFARLLQLAGIESRHKVLIVGALHGYSAAVISHLANEVVALESDASAVAAATPALQERGIANVTVVSGQLVDGWPAGAPFDVIFVEGAVEQMPAQLIDQLAPSGRLVTVELSGAVGRGVIVQKSGTDGRVSVSRRVAFEASAPRLPGFERAKVFSF